MAEELVVTKSLTKKYGKRVAVSDVDLTVRRGEVYGFLGPNGAGKTTALRVVLGLASASSGTATVLGLPAGHPDAVRRTGALVEGPGFYPYLTGWENLCASAYLCGLSARDIDEALDRVGMTVRASDRYRSYSLGMKQRLGVASALLGHPELLILDEPTNGLDPGGMADMRVLIRELADQGQTVMLSSHVLAEIEEICDRVGIISAGKLLAESSVSELRGAQAIVVRAEPVSETLAIGMRLAGDDGVRVVDGGAVRMALDPSHIPFVMAELVAAGLRVYDVHADRRSLEDAFFELTGSATDGGIG